MWRFLGLMVFCSLAGPSQGDPKEMSPGMVSVFSQAAFSKSRVHPRFQEHSAGYFLKPENSWIRKELEGAALDGPGMYSGDLSTTLLRHGLIQSHILAISFPDSPHRGHPDNWIKELHIVKVFVPTFILELHEKGYAMLCVKARLHLSTKFFFGKHFERIDVIIDVDVRTEFKFIDFLAGLVDVRFESCRTEFHIAKIICPSHLLVKTVSPVVATVLAASLPKSLCHVVEVVLNLARVEILYTANVFVSMGSVATIQYQLASLPLITSHFFALELNMIIRTGGRFITIPFSAVPVPVPSLLDNALSLGVTEASLSAIFSVLLQIQAHEFMCTSQVFSGADDLTIAVAALFAHQKCPKCPVKSPLKITISLIGEKRMIIEPKRAILELSVEITILSQGPTGAFSGLFVLKANLKLSTQASVHDCKLIFSTKLTSIDLLLVSSDVGPLDISGLVKWIQLLLVETFVPQINEHISIGIPVPSLLDIKVAYPIIQMMQGMLVISV